MTDKQFYVLNNLRLTLTELAKECENDNNFNSLIGDLEILQHDALETVDRINEVME